MRILFLCFLFTLSQGVFSQVTFAGFDTVICGAPQNYTYTYINYTFGTGSSFGAGYKIYRNGMQVYDTSGTQAGNMQCKDLIFINDSIGFKAVRVGASGTWLYKTSDRGVTWFKMASGMPDYFATYVINANYAYFITYYAYNVNAVSVIRASDIEATVNWPPFIYDNQINADIYANDTLVGNGLCHRDSLRIFIRDTIGDTIAYHINFTFQPVGIAMYEKAERYPVYPNPANEVFKIDFTDQIKSVEVFFTHGQSVKRFGPEEINKNRYPIRDLENGIYFVEIKSATRLKVIKLLISH